MPQSDPALAEFQQRLSTIAESFPATRLLVDMARDAGVEVIKRLLTEVRHLNHQIEKTERKREKLNDRLLDLLHDLSTGSFPLPTPVGRLPVDPEELLSTYHDFRDDAFPALASVLQIASSRSEVNIYQIVLVGEILLKGSYILAEHTIRHAGELQLTPAVKDFRESLRHHIAGNINHCLSRDIGFQVTPEYGILIERLIERSILWLEDLLASSPMTRLLVPKEGDRFDSTRHLRASRRETHHARTVRAVLFPGLYLPGHVETILEKAIVHTDRISQEVLQPAAEVG